MTLDIAILLSFQIGAHDLAPIISARMTGPSQDPNAFAFMLLLASAAVAGARWSRSAGILGMLLLGIWYTGSRAAFVTLPVVLAGSLYMRTLSARHLAQSLAIAVGLLAFISAVPPLLMGADWLSIFKQAWLSANPLSILSSPSSDAERWRTLQDGWQMFLDHPLFGTGLGAYMHEHAIVIHSVPLWLMAEMGLVGLVVLTAPIFTAFLIEAHRPVKDAAGVILILIIAAFATFGLAHEIMYQRAFWLILGAATACRPISRATKTDARTSFGAKPPQRRACLLVTVRREDRRPPKWSPRRSVVIAT